MRSNIYSLAYGINFQELPKIMVWRDYHMFNLEQLNELKRADIKKVDKSELVDMKALNVPIDRLYTYKLSDYFDFVRNPYMFRVGDVGVKVNFGNGKRFSDSIMDVVTNPDEFL